MKQRPSLEVVRHLLNYDENTGRLTWRKRVSSRAGPGDIAGCNDGKGYVLVGICGQHIRAHVLAWAIKTGEWPTSELDHKNQIKSDNRWSNLRLSSPQHNAQNRSTPNKNSVVGRIGVSPHRGRFMARIKIDGKHKYLGTHDTPDLAHQAYVTAKRQVHQGGTL
jgi:hypothetical protein